MLSPGRLCLRAVRGSGCNLLTATTYKATTTETLHSPAFRVLEPRPPVSSLQLRNFNSVKFSPKFVYYSCSDVKLPKKMSELSHALEGHTRPCTLLLTWLLAKDRHIAKYVKFYNNLGIDVLNVKFTPLDIVSPKIHAQTVVDEFLHFLHHYPANSPLLVHGFSVGGYLCAATLIDIENNFEKHGHLLDRFVGQIWDSVVDVGGLPIGVARSLTDNVVLQRKIQSGLEWYLKTQYKNATVFYERASVIFHKNFMDTPGLFLVSSNDPISPPEMVMTAHDAWQKLGYPVFAKIWNDTKHVTHYRSHPKEYEGQVLNFLKEIGLSVPVRSSVLPYAGKVQQTPLRKLEHPEPVLTLSR